jgi:hypothetical protein
MFCQSGADILGVIIPVLRRSPIFAAEEAGQKIANILKQRENQLAGKNPMLVKNKNDSTSINANFNRVDQEMKIMEDEFFENRKTMA